MRNKNRLEGKTLAELVDYYEMCNIEKYYCY
jgi:hypothetical protein